MVIVKRYFSYLFILFETLSDYLLDNELSAKGIDQELYIRMLDIRANLYLHINKADQIAFSEESAFIREASIVNLYYRYFQRTAFLAYLHITQANTTDDIYAAMVGNIVLFDTFFGIFNGREVQDAFNETVLKYMNLYPDRLIQTTDSLMLDIGIMEYPQWLFLEKPS